METTGSIGILRAPLLDLRLETPRLDLRPLGKDDAGDLARHLADVAVTRWLARVPHPYGLPEASAFVDHVRLAALAGTAATFGITLRSAGDDRVVGVIAVHGLEGTPEFGYWLARPFWGLGLMTEAAGAMLAWIHGGMDLAEIRSGAFEGNEASLAIQRRFGFRPVGRSTRPCLARGGDHPHVDTVLTRAAYEAALAG